MSRIIVNYDSPAGSRDAKLLMPRAEALNSKAKQTLAAQPLPPVIVALTSLIAAEIE